jgi:hypothetical protein
MLLHAIANTLSARNIIVETVFITDFKFSPFYVLQMTSMETSVLSP